MSTVEAIAYLLNKKKLTIKQLSELTGIDPAVLHRYTSARRNVKLFQIEKIMVVLNRRERQIFSDLLFDSPQKTSAKNYGNFPEFVFKEFGCEKYEYAKWSANEIEHLDEIFNNPDRFKYLQHEDLSDYNVYISRNKYEKAFDKIRIFVHKDSSDALGYPYKDPFEREKGLFEIISGTNNRQGFNLFKEEKKVIIDFIEYVDMNMDDNIMSPTLDYKRTYNDICEYKPNTIINLENKEKIIEFIDYCTQPFRRLSTSDFTKLLFCEFYLDEKKRLQKDMFSTDKGPSGEYYPFYVYKYYLDESGNVCVTLTEEAKKFYSWGRGVFEKKKMHKNKEY